MNKKDNTILYIDTTSKTLMTGISQNGTMQVFKKEASQSHRYHSAILIPTVETLLEELNLKSSDLSALAVNIGPGSFTGIRTGLSAIRTFGQFLEIPVYAFNSFEVLAHNSAGANTSIYIDALQSHAYYARLCFNDDGSQYLSQPSLVPMDSIQDSAHAPVEGDYIVISESLEKHFAGQSPEFISVIENSDHFSPNAMNQLIAKYANNETHPFAYQWDQVKALYLQNPNITLRKARPGTLK